MKFTKFVAPLLLLPSLAFAHSTEMIFNTPIHLCTTGTYNGFQLTLSNLSDHAASVQVEFLNKSGQSVVPTTGLSQSDYLPGESFSIPANSTVAYEASFNDSIQNSDTHNKCSTYPTIVKIVKDKNSQILATGWTSANTYRTFGFTVNQGKAF